MLPSTPGKMHPDWPKPPATGTASRLCGCTTAQEPVQNRCYLQGHPHHGCRYLRIELSGQNPAMGPFHWFCITASTMSRQGRLHLDRHWSNRHHGWLRDSPTMQYPYHQNELQLPPHQKPSVIARSKPSLVPTPSSRNVQHRPQERQGNSDAQHLSSTPSKPEPQINADERRSKNGFEHLRSSASSARVFSYLLWICCPMCG